MQAALNQVRFKWGSFVGPAFLSFVLLAFFVFPGTTLDKFNMVCFGI
jgi:hypothetical protein